MPDSSTVTISNRTLLTGTSQCMCSYAVPLRYSKPEQWVQHQVKPELYEATSAITGFC